VVFITHDFDEAIRLADRIAIMKDGILVQVGTAEELVNHPATEYVAEFTKDVNRAKVLTARSLMVPASAKAAGYPQVSTSDRIDSFSARIVDSATPFAVINGEGAVVGEVSAAAVIDLLAGKERPEQ
jgi:glycine betaine/proline transport system ATP-binding protein